VARGFGRFGRQQNPGPGTGDIRNRAVQARSGTPEGCEGNASLGGQTALLSRTTFYWLGLIFAWQFCTGIGIPPLPEEATILWAGAMAKLNEDCAWWLAWPTCIVAIILADLVLYSAGRYGGEPLLSSKWVRRFVPDERRLKLEHGFRSHGVKILITARLLPLPGIRTAVFLTAGSIRYPFFRFFIADIVYAIPGVGFFFFCSYFSAEGLLRLYRLMGATLFWVLVPAVLLGAAYLLHRYLKNLRQQASAHLDRPPRLSDLVPHPEAKKELENCVAPVAADENGRPGSAVTAETNRAGSFGTAYADDTCPAETGRCEAEQINRSDGT
jgi:membrane protein DedA with SNARE-associated domain